MKFGRFCRVVSVALLSTAIATPVLVTPTKPAQAYTILGGFGEVVRLYALEQAFFGGASLGTLIMLDYVISQNLGIPTLLSDLFDGGNARSFGFGAFGYADENEAAFAYAKRGNANAYNQVFTKAMAKPMQNWQGFYIGGNIGASQGTSNWRDTVPTIAGIAGSEFSMRGLGVTGGAQAGFNFQSGRFVYGIEGTISGSSLDNTRVLNLPPAVGTFKSGLNWLATGTARIGYTFGRSMLYAKAGVAVGEFENSFRLDGTAGPFIFPGGTSTHVGWTVGAGAERAISDRWALRYDISYADFGRQRYESFLPAFGPAIADINHTVITSTIGLNYRFGGPVVAKY